LLCGCGMRHRVPDPSSVTVIKDAAGWYHASFVVRVDDVPLPETGTDVGIDLGLTRFAVMSDGSKVDAAKFLRRAARKLKWLQQGPCAARRRARRTGRRPSWR